MLENVHPNSSHQSIAILADNCKLREVELPENDDDSFVVGCKKASNVCDRTAGILAVVRPCCIVVNFSEMFTCESVMQAYAIVFISLLLAVHRKISIGLNI